MGNGNERRKGVLAVQIVRNLWSELDGQRNLEAANRNVQCEAQAAHLSATRMVQPVMEREDGVAALAAIW